MSVQDERLLDAALKCFRDLGITRTTTDDIAREAGVNRTTLYRRLGDKDAIVRAALTKEVLELMAEIHRRIDDMETLEERATTGFAVAVTLVRQHPQWARSLLVERDEILAFLTVDSAPIVELASSYVAEMIAVAKDQFGVPRSDRDPETAAMLVRLVQSLVLVPDAPPRLETEAELSRFASQYLLPALDDGAKPTRRRRRTASAKQSR